jgi:hypothetical protein
MDTIANISYISIAGNLRLEHALSELTNEHHTFTQHRHTAPGRLLLDNLDSLASDPLCQSRCVWRFFANRKFGKALRNSFYTR